DTGGNHILPEPASDSDRNVRNTPVSCLERTIVYFDAIAQRFVVRPVLCVLLMAGSISAQSLDGGGNSPVTDAAARGIALAQDPASVMCESTNNERKQCAADTSGGV